MKPTIIASFPSIDTPIKWCVVPLKRGDHVTAMYTVLDVENGILSVASAGHLPLIFWKFTKKGSALLNPEGIAIGLDKGPVFEKTVVDKRIKLEKADRYVLYTDGALAAYTPTDVGERVLAGWTVIGHEVCQRA